MIVYLIIFCIQLYVALNHLFVFKKRNKKIYNKNVLIIGGGSGLGLSFAYTLLGKSNKVSATSRSTSLVNEMNKSTSIRFFHCDVFDDKTFETLGTSYDIIFYCAGLSVPGRCVDTSVKDFRLCSETNYMGMIKILKHYTAINKKPFDFVIIGSTLSTFPLQGYAAYSPTKSALLSFFYTCYDEFKKLGVKLLFFSPANMNTRGFLIENTTKPTFTKAIEKLQTVYEPNVCAEYFLANYYHRKVIVMDWFSYIWQIRYNCEKPVDYIWFPLSVVFVFVTKVFCKMAYKFLG